MKTFDKMIDRGYINNIPIIYPKEVLEFSNISIDFRWLQGRIITSFLSEHRNDVKSDIRGLVEEYGKIHPDLENMIIDKITQRMRDFITVDGVTPVQYFKNFYSNSNIKLFGIASPNNFAFSHGLYLLHYKPDVDFRKFLLFYATEIFTEENKEKQKIENILFIFPFIMESIFFDEPYPTEFSEEKLSGMMLDFDLHFTVNHKEYQRIKRDVKNFEENFENKEIDYSKLKKKEDDKETEHTPETVYNILQKVLPTQLGEVSSYLTPKLFPRRFVSFINDMWYIKAFEKLTDYGKRTLFKMLQENKANLDELETDKNLQLEVFFKYVGNLFETVEAYVGILDLDSNERVVPNKVSKVFEGIKLQGEDEYIVRGYSFLEIMYYKLNEEVYLTQEDKDRLNNIYLNYKKDKGKVKAPNKYSERQINKVTRMNNFLTPENKEILKENGITFKINASEDDLHALILIKGKKDIALKYSTNYVSITDGNKVESFHSYETVEFKVHVLSNAIIELFKQDFIQGNLSKKQQIIANQLISKSFDERYKKFTLL